MVHEAIHQCQSCNKRSHLFSVSSLFSIQVKIVMKRVAKAPKMGIRKSGPILLQGQEDNASYETYINLGGISKQAIGKKQTGQ